MGWAIACCWPRITFHICTSLSAFILRGLSLISLMQTSAVGPIAGDPNPRIASKYGSSIFARQSNSSAPSYQSSAMARGRRSSSRVVLVLGAGVAACVTAKSLAGFAFTGLGRAASMGLQQRTRSSVPGAELPLHLPSRPALPVGVEEVATTSSLLESMGPSVVAGQAVAGLAALYVIMSFCEYVYHRYFQHLGLNKVNAVRAVRSTLNLSTFRGDGHVEHHRETVEEDMSLTVEPGRDPILDMDPWRGTCFPWDGFAKMSAGVMLLAYPTLTLLGWSGFVIVPVVMTAMILHALVWNALHPNMHGLEDVPVEVGAPSWVLSGFRDSAVFNYLRTNHEGHHRATGSHGNYNVCCPGMDQLVGTTVDCVTGAPLPKPVPDWVTLLVAVAAAPLMPAFAVVCLVVLISFPPLPRAAELGAK